MVFYTCTAISLNSLISSKHLSVSFLYHQQQINFFFLFSNKLFFFFLISFSTFYFVFLLLYLSYIEIFTIAIIAEILPLFLPRILGTVLLILNIKYDDFSIIFDRSWKLCIFLLWHYASIPNVHEVFFLI